MSAVTTKRGVAKIPIRVMHVGLGPIGTGILRQVATRKGFKVVGGIDIDPAKAGKDLGEIAGLDHKLGVRVTEDPVAAIKQAKPEVVVLCTRSSLRAVMPQLETVLKLRVPIVSTTVRPISRLRSGPFEGTARARHRLCRWYRTLLGYSRTAQPTPRWTQGPTPRYGVGDRAATQGRDAFLLYSPCASGDRHRRVRVAVRGIRRSLLSG